MKVKITISGKEKPIVTSYNCNAKVKFTKKFLYAINGGDFSGSNTFEKLMPGQYYISVMNDKKETIASHLPVQIMLGENKLTVTVVK